MTTQIKVTGTQNLGSVQFTGIEGGFGEGKKAMLVKDIAAIHGREVKAINQAINSNIERFKDGTDFIDILGVNQIDPKEFGYTQQAINSYVGLKNKGLRAGIYLLSERGYFKLLKILEDDTAWEIYDQLVDTYFNMRSELDTSNLSPELQMFNGLFKSLAKQELATKQLESKVDSISEIVAVNTVDWRKDTRQLINAVAKTQGGFSAYQEIQSEIYTELERRASCKLSIRLTNKRNVMAGEGVSKSKRDKLNKVDVIADDKKLVEIYMAIVKEFAIKSGVWNG
ncbi:ORF6N domain-containing protein [Pseudolactococcus raffinolactis]|uniref:ORF6N domain-containing protein n=1 Tax=Pseudolactococcus raffinolactis TaxID=1366 RepID=UPI002416E1EC|nr:ORF6N domain-containing protein [Lactococcus raffinolactis]MDG4961520.1 ORF6N domain-containing protein [Lactococcus raffinolactis]